MTTWAELLRSRLGLASERLSEAEVPFALPGVAASEWRAEGLAEEGGDWVLTARTGAGLSARFVMRFFDDTRAVEMWGEVVHRGTEAVPGVVRSMTLDVDLLLDERYDRAWVRSVNGVRQEPTFFPPDDFAVVDRQLTSVPWLSSTVTLHSAANGRTSAHDLPCAVVGDEGGTGGFALMLEWSGLWTIAVGRRAVAKAGHRGLRVQAGMWGLDLELRPGERLPLPRLLLTAFDGGLEAGGNALRRHVRRHVTPRLGGEPVLPPTSFNHYFAYLNDFTADLLRPEVAAAAAAGLEYFVVDGGWFRGGFPEGVGNWSAPDPAKFPEGVEAFSAQVRAAGMRFGLWFEPEWAHVGSELYREHPEWFWPTPPLRAAGMPHDPSGFFESSDYALIDLGNPEVQAWWVARIEAAYRDWGVRWIRWDFNHNPRAAWDHGVEPGRVGWRQIRHVEGLYAVLDEIMRRCPDLLIEQCASGGHRIDLGTVRRGHTFWMNDITVHTDLVRALQHGLNTVLPGNYANTNLCQPRHDFTDYDYLSHGTGGLGYSGRLSEAPPEEFARFAAAVERFKGYRELLLGDYERPTGQPRRADERAVVRFRDGGSILAVEFNDDGAGSARVRVAPESVVPNPRM